MLPWLRAGNSLRRPLASSSNCFQRFRRAHHLPASTLLQPLSSCSSTFSSYDGSKNSSHKLAPLPFQVHFCRSISSSTHIASPASTSIPHLKNKSGRLSEKQISEVVDHYTQKPPVGMLISIYIYDCVYILYFNPKNVSGIRRACGK